MYSPPRVVEEESDQNESIKEVNKMGGAVAEWCKALLVRENKRKSKKIPGLPPDLLKKVNKSVGICAT